MAPRPEWWVLIGDLQAYFTVAPRPSGIQRTVIEILAVWRRMGRPVRLCRMDAAGGLREVDWSWFEAAVSPPARPSPVAAGTGPVSPPSMPSLRTTDHMDRAGTPAGSALRRSDDGVSVGAWIRQGGTLIARRWPAAAEFLRWWRRPAALRRWRAALVTAGRPAAPAPGDVLVVLGAPWVEPGIEGRLEGVLATRGLRLAVLVYDLLPITHPHCFPAGPDPFVPWIEWCQRRADGIATISGWSVQAVLDHRRRLGLPAMPVARIRLGDPDPADADPHPWAAAGPYALCVGTIEPRKNHRMLVEAWLLLRARLGDRCPRLVIAGRRGWLVGDLMEQLAACRWLDGLIIHRPDADDGELDRLYAGALFTVFPSVAEGWGLPVAESLAHGRPCLAADAAAVPEAGGGWADLIDPFDVRALAERIERWIDDPRALERRAAEIRTGWRGIPWSQTAAEVADWVQGIADRAPALPTVSFRPPAQREEAI